MTTETSEQVDEDNSAASRSGARVTVLVAVAAALAFLLIGATAGMLITLSAVDQNTTPATDSVDVGFSQDMSVHHLQAVTMASWARVHSTDPAIQTLAFDIESTQQAQVGMMSGWLMLWNQRTTPTGTHMTWMVGPATHGHSATTSAAVPAGGVRIMPGMATQQEITTLRSVSGRELDVYFLQLVLRHHAGGAPMAQYAAERAGQSAVRTLADSIVKSQTAEMDTIKSMLTQRGAQPLPYVGSGRRSLAPRRAAR